MVASQPAKRPLKRYCSEPTAKTQDLSLAAGSDKLQCLFHYLLPLLYSEDCRIVVIILFLSWNNKTPTFYSRYAGSSATVQNEICQHMHLPSFPSPRDVLLLLLITLIFFLPLRLLFIKILQCPIHRQLKWLCDPQQQQQVL